MPDLLDAESGLALEYDGASWRSDRANGHRDREQHREDNAREERLERAGLIVVRVEKSDLTKHRHRLGERILGARADGLRRDRARDRWTWTSQGTGSACPPDINELEKSLRHLNSRLEMPDLLLESGQARHQGARLVPIELPYEVANVELSSDGPVGGSG